MSIIRYIKLSFSSLANIITSCLHQFQYSFLISVPLIRSHALTFSPLSHILVPIQLIFIFNVHSWGWSPYWVHSARRLLLAYCTCPGWLWGWRIWWNKDWCRISMYSKKTCFSAALSTTNPTSPHSGANSARRGEKPATNRLCYGATFQYI
jgi:hypothetical protein